MTQTDGRLLAVEVHPADVQDRDGAKGVLKRSRARSRRAVATLSLRTMGGPEYTGSAPCQDDAARPGAL